MLNSTLELTEHSLLQSLPEEEKKKSLSFITEHGEYREAVQIFP